MTIQEHQRRKWEELKKEISEKITKIDKDTPWSEMEPEWWLEMSNIQQHLVKGGIWLSETFDGGIAT